MLISAKEIINNLMLDRGLRRKRDVAKYFGVTPQALSIWIAKDQIPPKHLLKLSRLEKMEKPFDSKYLKHQATSEADNELQTVINYLMKENFKLKEKVKSQQSQIKNSFTRDGGVFDKIIADSLFLSGRVSDGIITETNGDWAQIMGYDPNQLIGKRYDRDDLIHPDDLKAAKKIQQTLKKSQSITSSKYSAIQRWKNGKTGIYTMLSMVWDINVNDDIALIICKQIDGFISE